MKAPDKIYINITPLGVDYSIVPIPDFGGVEYIRKDYLLEWAKGEVKHYLNSEEYDFGWNMAIQKLIDKLNEI